MGGLLYGTVLDTLVEDAFATTPVERPVSKRAIQYLGNGQHLSLSFGSDAWTRPPCNHTYVVNRSQFDRWFAGHVEAAGVSLLEGTVVDGLRYDGEGPARKVVGVHLRGDEALLAEVVVLAEGANCLVTEQAIRALGLRPGRRRQEYAVGVKEIIALPREKIEDRFGLAPDEGAAFDFLGVPFEGMIGGGFLYTAREAVHLGAAVRIDTLVNRRGSPNEVLDRFKNHPAVRTYLAGGELLEYSAHMLPEGGYDCLGTLTGNGVMIVGDAAGLLNASLYKEGTNHAMESGRAAGLAAAEAKAAGDFSARGLAGYERRLREGPALQDLRKYRDLPDLLEHTPELLSLYPRKVTQLLVDFFTVTGEPKQVLQKRAIRTFLDGLPKVRFVRDLVRARKLL